MPQTRRSWYSDPVKRLIRLERDDSDRPYKVLVHRRANGTIFGEPVLAGYVWKTESRGRAFRWRGSFQSLCGVGRVDGSTLREVAETLAGRLEFGDGE